MSNCEKCGLPLELCCCAEIKKEEQRINIWKQKNMNGKLRLLIGEEKWKELQQKHPQLEELQYLAVCETCGRIFFDQPLVKVQEMLLSGEWDPYQPQLWFVEAGRHWVAQKFHAVRVYVTAKDGDRTLIKDLSAEWSQDVKAHGYTDLAMLNELNDLEKYLKKRASVK